MPKIPSLTARQIIRALHRAGFIEDRQKGGHLVMLNVSTKTRTIIPIHSGKTIKKSLVHAIMNDAKLTTEKFLELL